MGGGWLLPKISPSPPSFVSTTCRKPGNAFSGYRGAATRAPGRRFRTAHRNSQPPQPANVMTNHALPLSRLQRPRRPLLVRLAGRQHLKNQSQQVMRHRHHRSRPLAAMFRGDAPELLFQEAVFSLGRPLGTLRQGAPQPRVALVGRAALVFTRTPVIARAHPGPRTDMRRISKCLHIGSGLRQNGGRTILPYPRDALQQFPLPCQTDLPDLGGNLLVQPQDRPLQQFHVLHAEANHAPMMLTEAMLLQSSHQGRDLLARPALGQAGDFLRPGVSLQQGLPHALSGDPNTSDSTLPSFTLASSSTFWMRFFSLLPAAISFLRRR